MTRDRNHDLSTGTYILIGALAIGHEVFGLTTTLVVAFSFAGLVLVASLGAALFAAGAHLSPTTDANEHALAPAPSRPIKHR